MFINTHPGQVMKRNAREVKQKSLAEESGELPPGFTCHGAASSISPPESDNDTSSGSAAHADAASKGKKKFKRASGR